MTKTIDSVAINDWQVIGRIDDFLKDQPKQTRLLGQSLIAERHKNGDIKVHEALDEVTSVMEGYYDMPYPLDR